MIEVDQSIKPSTTALEANRRSSSSKWAKSSSSCLSVCLPVNLREKTLGNVCSQSACMQPALGYGSTYQSFDDPVLRCWCNLQRGRKKTHTKNRMRWRGVTRQSARTGKKCGGRKKWNTVCYHRRCLAGLWERVVKNCRQNAHQYGCKWHLSLTEASKNLNSRIVGPNLGYVCLSSL